ncbi:MAG: Flp pilus assembly protein CpaB [Planctomycetaceae bacterium]|nr:Flp pilus assembly protein CpaB [Planctomycetaceae bacterium]MBP61656.1 Flp pilus assembly protein CpaB [Planctomycetaceae bacterium]
MRPKSMILIVIALGCGLVASIGISQVMENRPENVGIPEIEMVSIYVAQKEINVGETIQEEMISLEEWPADRAPASVIIELEEVVNHRSRQQIFVGEPILMGKLIGENEKAVDAAERIRPGYRAVTVLVNEAVAVGNLLKPGDSVDVLVYLREGADIPQTTMKTILEQVRVFAINDTMDRIEGKNGTSIKAKTVTLEVEPSQVELITLADAIGRIRLSARRPDDESNCNAGGVTPSCLLSNRHNDSVPEEETSPPDWLVSLGRETPTEAPLGESLPRMMVIERDVFRQYEIPPNGEIPREVTYHQGFTEVGGDPTDLRFEFQGDLANPDGVQDDDLPFDPDGAVKPN